MKCLNPGPESSFLILRSLLVKELFRQKLPTASFSLSENCLPCFYPTHCNDYRLGLHLQNK